MNQPSSFQAQYPLSPRKFWKKCIQGSVPYFFLALLIGVLVDFFVVITPQVNNQTADFSGVFYFVLPILGCMIIFMLAVFLLRAWYVKVYIKRYYYDCGEQFVTIKKGVFAPTEIHVQYQKIQDVYVDQDLLDRMMGLYDVHIASATVTSGIEAHIDGVNAEVAESLKNILLEKIHTGGTSNSAQTPASPQPAPQNPVLFGKKISSETYPINSSWIYPVIWGSIVFGLLWAFLFTIFFAQFLVRESFLAIFSFIVVFFLVLFFLRLIFVSVWKKNYYFEFMPDYILLRTGVISKSENHLPYKSIQNILNKQGIVDRMFGLSTVVIQNAAQQMVSPRGQALGSGSTISLVWQPKDKAEELNNLLNDIVTKINPQNSNNMGV